MDILYNNKPQKIPEQRPALSPAKYDKKNGNLQKEVKECIICVTFHRKFIFFYRSRKTFTCMHDSNIYLTIKTPSQYFLLVCRE